MFGDGADLTISKGPHQLCSSLSPRCGSWGRVQMPPAWQAQPALWPPSALITCLPLPPSPLQRLGLSGLPSLAGASVGRADCSPPIQQQGPRGWRGIKLQDDGMQVGKRNPWWFGWILPLYPVLLCRPRCQLSWSQRALC